MYSDYNFSLETNAQFKSLEEVFVGFQKRYVYLVDEFEPTGKDGALPLPANQGYHFNSFQVGFQSDERKVFAYSASPSYGQFFNGNRYGFEANMRVRLQPKVTFGLDLQYDHIELPAPFSRTDLWLVSPRVNITFNKSIFWSTLFSTATSVII